MSPKTPVIHRSAARDSYQAVRELRKTYRQQRQNAISAFRRHLRPETLLAALRRITDRALVMAVKQYPLPDGAALVAIGGYGRGELYPYSDVDVLILLDRSPDTKATRCIERLVAALWNLGLDLSHSVRSVAECLDGAASDTTIETSLLETRWLTGNQDIYYQLQAASQSRIDPQRFFRDKQAEMQQRHAHYKNTAYALEPNCKESPGGLRDLLVILWIAQAAGLGNTWRDIATSGLLSPAESRSIRRAELAFKRLRIELHLLTGRREDRVLFDLQPELARRYGFAETRTRRPSELLMQRYYWAARVVSQLNLIMMQLLEERLIPAAKPVTTIIDANFRLQHDKLDIRHPATFEDNPGLLFRAFLLASDKSDGVFSARTLRAMWHARKRINVNFRRNPANQQLFLQILQQKHGVSSSLQTMTLLNLLPNYLPEFRRIVGQMQHDLFHAYTVDQHTLLVINNLRRFIDPGQADKYPLASRLMAELEHPWLLYIAALYHDIAKGRGGDHSELGAQDARRFCQRHNLCEKNTDLVVFLVREHLSLSRFAQKRDLSDTAVIYEFARLVKTPERLNALYLLTVADIRGTSSRVWNAWKGKLLETLYTLTLTALGNLSRGAAMPDRETVLFERKKAAAEQIAAMGISTADRDALWNKLVTAYFLRHSTDEIAWHAAQLHKYIHQQETVVSTRIIGNNDGLQVMVYTPDRDDLFITICHYFEREQFTIQEARIHTTLHGWALDSFVVLPVLAGHSLEQAGSQIAHGLRQTLKTDGPVHYLPPTSQASRHRTSRRARTFPVAPAIELQPDESNQAWRLAVTAADRPGLLYSLARVFAQHGISLLMAKIHTLGDRIEDTFIIRGDALEHPQSLVQFERNILAILQPPTQ